MLYKYLKYTISTSITLDNLSFLYHENSEDVFVNIYTNAEKVNATLFDLSEYRAVIVPSMLKYLYCSCLCAGCHLPFFLFPTIVVNLRNLSLVDENFLAYTNHCFHAKNNKG